MLNILLPILFFVSLAGALYIILRKFPVLANIPVESIENRETFFAFLKRVFLSIFSYVHFKKIKIYFLVVLDKILVRFRSSILKVHKTIETLSEDIKQKSHQEKWEHQWFLHKEKDKNKKEK